MESNLYHGSMKCQAPLPPPGDSLNQQQTITAPANNHIPTHHHHQASHSSTTNENESTSTRSRCLIFWRWLQKIEGIVAVSYFCNVVARALPVLLVPIAVEERVMDNNGYLFDDDDYFVVLDDDDDKSNDGTVFLQKRIAAQVALITSMAFGGGAVGKLVNGFVCQQRGSYRSSQWYLAGLAVCSFLFSLSTTAGSMGLAYAGMEFFSSIQYGSLAVLLTHYYVQRNDHARLVASLTALGLASTTGEILAKIAGTFLAGYHHWRFVAKLGAATALMGSLIIAQAPGRAQADRILKIKREQGQFGVLYNILKAIRDVMGSRKFWVLAFAYSMVFVCYCLDRILVSFYYEVSQLPHNICGGLTLSITLGLVHGLISGSRQYAAMVNLEQKMSFLRNRYIGNIVSTLGLAALSHYGPLFISNNETLLRKVLVALGVFVLSAAMADAIAFQSFQLPTMISQEFADNKAVCISWLEGMGFIFSIPTFRALVYMVPRCGWIAGWIMLAVLFALGGIVMLSAIGPILDSSDFYDDDQKKNKDPWRFFDWAVNVYDTVLPEEGCYGTDYMANCYVPESPYLLQKDLR